MDAAAGGAFLSLTINQATALVEKMASNQGWNEERTQTCKRGGGMCNRTDQIIRAQVQKQAPKRSNF
jgi:hypothetical protein